MISQAGCLFELVSVDQGLVCFCSRGMLIREETMFNMSFLHKLILDFYMLTEILKICRPSGV